MVDQTEMLTAETGGVSGEWMGEGGRTEEVLAVDEIFDVEEADDGADGTTNKISDNLQKALDEQCSEAEDEARGYLGPRVHRRVPEKRHGQEGEYEIGDGGNGGLLVGQGDGDGVVDALVLDLLVEEVPRVPAAERHEEDVEQVDDGGEDHCRNHEPAVALADDDAQEEEPQREFERYLGEEIEDFVDDNPLQSLELFVNAEDAHF